MRHNQALAVIHAQAKGAKHAFTQITDCGVYTLHTAAATLKKGAANQPTSAEVSRLKTEIYRQCTRQYLAELYSAAATELTTISLLAGSGCPQPQRPKSSKAAYSAARVRYLAMVSTLYQNQPKSTQGGAGWQRWFPTGK